MQLALLAALAVASIRAGYIFYQRYEDQLAAERQKQARDVGYSNPDYYVTPKKLYPYDVKSAKQLTQQPVWVKEGYRYAYYRYAVGERVDFGHEAGLLGANRETRHHGCGDGNGSHRTEATSYGSFQEGR